MSYSPLVSVIVPNYNHGRYLDQRLQTVLNQTYQNFEVIILDDCSTDNSLEVIAKYEDNPHVKLTVVNDHNSGSTFKQWNKGIHLAQGDLVWIAESDDYCELNLLEELVGAYVRQKGCVLAYSTINLVDDDGVMLRPGLRGKNQYFCGTKYVKRYLSHYCSVRNASSAIFAKNVALTIPEDYVQYKGAGDYLFWVCVALEGNVAIINNPISYCRRHNGTVTSARNADGTNFREERLIWDFIKSKVHISWVREQGALYSHWYRIVNQKYESEIIRNQIFDLWNVPQKISFALKILKKIRKKVRFKFIGLI